MAETFNCPNCGAPLDYKGNDPIIRCPYCSTSVVVPDNLRSKPSFSSQPHNFTLSGSGDMGALIQKARRIKEVKDLAQSGKTEQAITLYREITDSSHHDASAAVQALAEGRPITLAGFSAADVSAQVMRSQAAQYSAPAIQITTQASTRSWISSCISSCFVIGLVFFILAVTLIPIFASSLPSLMNNPNMPSIVLTVMPDISTAMPNGIPLLHTFAQQTLSFGSEGTGPGFFKDPRAIAVDPQSGNIYVSDFQGGRVQAFNATGKFITQWNVGDRKTIIKSMSVDHKGNLFVIATTNIYKYDTTGKALGQFKADDKVTFHYDDIKAAPDGTLYVIGGGETVVHMDADGQTLSSIPKAVSTVTDDPELGTRIAVDGQGNIYLLGTFNNAVFKFNSNGKYINEFGSEGGKQGQFRAPYAIAVDGQGRIYVSDIKGIQVFDNDGRYIDMIDIEGVAFGIVFDDQNKLYIATNQNKIIKFTIAEPGN
jgi:sugar lactone lactonase YvrE